MAIQVIEVIPQNFSRLPYSRISAWAAAGETSSHLTGFMKRQRRQEDDRKMTAATSPTPPFPVMSAPAHNKRVATRQSLVSKASSFPNLTRGFEHTQEFSKENGQFLESNHGHMGESIADVSMSERQRPKRHLDALSQVQPSPKRVRTGLTITQLESDVMDPRLLSIEANEFVTAISKNTLSKSIHQSVQRALVHHADVVRKVWASYIFRRSDAF